MHSEPCGLHCPLCRVDPGATPIPSICHTWGDWHAPCLRTVLKRLIMDESNGRLGFHAAVVEFKRRLIEATLWQLGGNRSRTARALGLQRTYLLRLIRDLEVPVPPPPERPVGRRRWAQ